MISTKQLQHIAIIMDGNSRWAKKHHKPVIEGLRAGVEAARNTITQCLKKNISVLSLLAVSSKNGQQKSDEDHFLIEPLLHNLEREQEILHHNNIKLRFIGEKQTGDLYKRIADIEQLTAKNTGMTLIIAAEYDGRWDIYQAALTC